MACEMKKAGKSSDTLRSVKEGGRTESDHGTISVGPLLMRKNYFDSK